MILTSPSCENYNKMGAAAFTDIAAKLQVSHGTIRNRGQPAAGRTAAENYRLGQSPGSRLQALPANIQIAVEPPARIREVALQLVDLPEARFVAMMSGEYDLFVDVNARDVKHLTEVCHRRHLPH